MLKKLVNWCNKIIPAIGAAILFVGVAIIVALAVVPHGKTYTYEMAGAYEVKIIFDDDDELVMEQTLGNKFASSEVECRINDGKLYTYDFSTKTWSYVGKIDAYKLTLKTSEQDEYDPNADLNIEIVMECKASYALRTLSIVLMAVGGVVALASIVVAILNKKGYIKLEKAVAAEAQVVEPAQEPQAQAEPVAEETVATESVEETKTE